MANHHRDPEMVNAYYDENDKGEVVLLLRPNCQIAKGAEIVINYGESKSYAEMLFSYGFLDDTPNRARAVFRVDIPDDDPLAKAKMHLFGEPPTVTLWISNEGTAQMVMWESPSAWLLCLNEEDGLSFRVLQDVEGNTQLRLLWQDVDITEEIKSIENVTKTHPLAAVFRLRVASMIQRQVQAQLERMQDADRVDHGPLSGTASIRTEAACMLRRKEMDLSQRALDLLTTTIDGLLEDETVSLYLQRMNTSQQSPDADEAAEHAVQSADEDDFS